jgi:hypothetical protein
MFNIKWGVVFGGAAFILALIFSLLFGKVLFLTALVRALIFAVTFFVLGTGAWLLISSYIPDLLSVDTREDPANIFASKDTPGSTVNITLGDTSGAALPDSGGGVSGADEVGDISDLVSGKVKPSAMPGAKDMDQMPSSDYTDNEGESSLDSGLSGGLAGGFAADSGSGGFFPDFSAFTGGLSSGGASGSSPSSANGKAAGTAAGDFGGFSGTGSDGVFDAGDIFSSAATIGNGADGTYGSDAASEDLPERKVSGNKPVEFEGDFKPKEIALGIHTMLEKENKG